MRVVVIGNLRAVQGEWDGVSEWRQREAVALMKSWKDNRPCYDCGVPYRYWVLEFDHVGRKTVNLGTEGKKLSEQELRYEMAQCDVICANCHKERTHQRQIQPRKKKP